MPFNAVGIDLGTTNSCVAVFENGKVEIITNGNGNRITPSFVAFNDEVRLIGDAAKKQVAMNPKNTVFNVKRLIGQKTTDREVQEDLKHWSFDVVSSAGNKPMIQVEFKGERKVLHPEEISAMILEDLKKTAERYNGAPVQNAVITVPAYFNDSQRQATKDAGRIAGFNVLAVLNEPTAAAIAYGFEKRKDGKKNILIYDLGGGTFDVTILTMENGSFDVKSTSGDVHLGGEDFDNRLVDFVARDLKNCYGKDVTTDARALRRLRTACERAKRNLSYENETSINIEAFIDGMDYHTRINSARFENICADLFQRTIGPVEDALKAANMRKQQIDDVVLIGGSIRIPKIQKMLSEFFDGKQLSQSINPDEAVAHGAAIQAALMSGNQSDVIGDIKFRDVTPLSLGISKHGNVMSFLIDRNTSIPVTKCKNYHTSGDYQTRLTLDVYEGERANPDENNHLGSFNLDGLPRALRGVAKADITFSIDSNGILTVSAKDCSNGNTKSITITNEAGRLSEEEIERMIANAEKFKELDIEYKKKAEVRNKVDNLIHDVRRVLRDTEIMQDFTDLYKSRVESLINSTSESCRNNPNATKTELIFAYAELKTVCEQIIDKGNINAS